MAALKYLLAYAGIWLEFRDHRAAKRAGQLAVLICRKTR